MRIAPVDVLWTARYDYEPGWKLVVHQHAYFQMIHILEGEGRFLLDGNAYPTASGMLFLIKPAHAHGMTAAGTVKTHDVKFHVARSALCRRLLAAPPVLECVDPGVPALFERIRFEGEHKNPLYREICGVCLSELLLVYLRGQGCPAVLPSYSEEATVTRDALLSRALGYIRLHFHNRISVPEVALFLGCSDRTLRERFRASLGVSPSAFIERYRIDRAKGLMERPDYALKEVAEAVGFKSIHHFTRIFSAAEGLPPGAWRRKYLEGIRKDVCIDPCFANPSFTVSTRLEPQSPPELPVRRS